MPIYEYICENSHCGAKFEFLQKVTEEPIKICPKCQEASLRKLISAAGFRLKGGGWYETDFKGNNDKKKNLSNKENAPGAKEQTKETKGNNEAATTTTNNDSKTSS